MATKKDDAAPPETLPATVQSAGLPDGMDEDWGHYGGAGTSERSDDSVIPFLKLLQDMSPEGQSRHEKYVEGAMVGALLNTATKRIWLPEHRDKEGQHPEEPCIVLPVMFQREICAWRPRELGGGLTGKYPITKSTVEETMKHLGGEYVKDPRDQKGQKMKWVLGDDDLIDTRYQFAVTLDGPELNEVSPVVMSFSSTGHQAARAWMALQRQPMPGRGIPPAWFRTYIAHRATRQNSQGNWFVLDMQLQGYTKSKDVREYCRQMYDSIQSGAVRAAEDEEAAPGVQAAQDGDANDVPF